MHAAKLRALVIILTGVISLSVPPFMAAEELEEVCRFHHGQTRAFGIELDGTGRRYAPDRDVDVLHIRLDVTPDFKARTVQGTTTLRFSPISKPVTQLKLHAVDLSVTDVRSETGIADVNNTGKHLIITFSQAISTGTKSVVEIDHHAEPTRGLYFRTPEMGYPDTDTHVWTQGEAHEARFWFPCFDFPNERSTTEVICHVPSDMTVLSNGRRVSESTDENGLKRVHWLQDKPHVNYLICLVAGHFEKLEKRHGDIPLGFYVQPSLIKHAQNSFRDTADIMAYFENEIGMPYPWNKYDQVTIRDFVAGGMENTTLTTLTHRTIFADATENIRTTRRLDVHEMAHQWFGDYVTCKDWSHLWLNEGFATFYTHLYEGHKFGEDAKLYGLYRDANFSILTKGKDKRPIVYNAYKNAGEQFDYRAYPKGSWVLHMLRSQVGPDLFRQSIRDYLNRHALESVVTDDLRQSFERVTGRTFDQFFDQWVYHAGHPQLKVTYEWQAKEKLAKVAIEQTQDVNEHSLLFAFPTKLRFITGNETVDHPILVTQKRHEFFVPLAGQPTVVRFDPHYTVLSKVDFKKSDDLLFAQLKRDDDAMGRVLAAEALGQRKTKKSIEHLRKVLANDAFFGVRIVAAQSLFKIQNDDAIDALTKSVQQDDARVRQEVVRQLAKSYTPESRVAIEAVLKEDPNPAIKAVAIRALGRYSDKKCRKLLAKYITSESFRNELCDAAIVAIEMQHDPRYRRILREVIRDRESSFTSGGLSAALRSLGKICRQQKKRSVERDFITEYLNHAKEPIRIGAIGALGELGDRASVPIVESFVIKDGSSSRITTAAKEALKKLQNESRSTPAEVVELRKSVSELKKANQELRKEFDTFKEKIRSIRGTEKEAEGKGQDS